MQTGLDRLAADAAVAREARAGRASGCSPTRRRSTARLVHVRRRARRASACGRRRRLRPRARLRRRGAGHDRRRRRARRARARPCAASTASASTTSRPSAEDLAGIDVLVVDLAGRRLALLHVRLDRACSRCARARAPACACSCSIGPNPIGGDRAQRSRGAGSARASARSSGSSRSRSATGSRSARSSRGAPTVEGVAARARRVVAVDGLDRARTRPAWDRPFVMPSPNMPTYETALVYPGGCLARGDEPLRGARHDAAVRDRRRAVDRRRDARRASSHALGLPGFARAPAHLPADVPQARAARLRRRADPRDRPARASARSRPTSRSSRSPRAGSGALSRSAPSATSSSTTSPRSTCSPATPRRASASRAASAPLDVAEAIAAVREGETRRSTSA